MRAEELDNLTPDQLAALANQHSLAAESLNPQQLNAVGERLAHLLQAQFYLTAAAKKRDDQAAAKREKRENFRYWLGVIIELGVVVLIGIEIGLSIHYGNKSIDDGREEALLLQNIKKSADDSLAAQTSSLARLRDMNTTLQESLKTTDAVAVAAKRQLGIQKQQQEEHLAQLGKKPKIVFYLAGAPLAIGASLKPREESDTSATFDCSLMNQGTGNATKVWLRLVVFSKEVTVLSNQRIFPAAEPPNSSFQTLLIPIDFIRPKLNLPFSITFTYPKGQAPFRVNLTVDAEEIETGTPLGELTFAPRKPAN